LLGVLGDFCAEAKTGHFLHHFSALSMFSKTCKNIGIFENGCVFDPRENTFLGHKKCPQNDHLFLEQKTAPTWKNIGFFNFHERTFLGVTARHSLIAGAQNRWSDIKSSHMNHTKTQKWSKSKGKNMKTINGKCEKQREL